MMDSLQLVCKAKQLKGEVWELYLTDKTTKLFDAEGNLVTSFSSKVAGERFSLPSFWESITDIGIKSEIQEVLWFYPNKNSIQVIKDYIAQSVTEQGPRAVEELKKKIYFHLFTGICLSLVGIVLTSIVFFQYSDVQGGIPRRVLYVSMGPLMYGLVQIYKATKSFRKYQHIQKLSSFNEN